MKKEKVIKYYNYVNEKKMPWMLLTSKTKLEIVKAGLRAGLNIECPEKFSEKVAWYTLYYKNNNFKDFVDKERLKYIVKENVGEDYYAALYGSWKYVDDVDWNSLPKTFVLKSNCSSFGENILFIDDKYKYDYDEIKEIIRPWLDFRNTAVNSLARAYYSVTPKIIAEELIGEFNHQPIDYKLFCFDGIPTYSYSAFEHFENGKVQSSKIAFYDMEWNVLPVMYKKSQCVPVEKPKHFEEMKKIATKLSQGLPFVRVDFYDTEEKPLVGEMTFYSGGFSNKFTPEAFDFEMGKHFVLPKKSKPYSKLRLDLYWQIFKNKKRK